MIPIDKEDCWAGFSLKSQNSGSEIPGAFSLLQAVQVSEKRIKLVDL